MRIILNPTWRCQYACAYCWVRALGWHGSTNERPVADWMRWIRGLPERCAIDVSGGEPLLYGGMLDLLRAIGQRGHAWAMTTNLAAVGWHQLLLGRHIPRALVINVSVHAQSPPDLGRRIKLLELVGYPMAVNVVEHPAAPPLPEGLGCRVSRIPYQPWQEQLAVDGVRRMCNAGMGHVAVDPAGRIYRCLVDMQLEQACLGTIDEPLGRVLLREPVRCDHGCTTCYTHAPGSWGVNMEPVR